MNIQDLAVVEQLSDADLMSIIGGVGTTQTVPGVGSAGFNVVDNSGTFNKTASIGVSSTVTGSSSSLSFDAETVGLP